MPPRTSCSNFLHHGNLLGTRIKPPTLSRLRTLQNARQSCSVWGQRVPMTLGHGSACLQHCGLLHTHGLYCMYRAYLPKDWMEPRTVLWYSHEGTGRHESSFIMLSDWHLDVLEWRAVIDARHFRLISHTTELLTQWTVWEVDASGLQWADFRCN